MQLHTLSSKNTHTKAARVGRGGKRGKTSGRGTKGAGARAGNKSRPEWRDVIKRLPKRRGYGKNRARSVVGSRVPAASINLSTLERHYNTGDVVSPTTLLEKKLIRRVSGRAQEVKILGSGELSKKLSFKGVSFSASARAAAEKVGGSITT
jgi:large subunit ribosomal protein L15